MPNTVSFKETLRTDIVIVSLSLLGSTLFTELFVALFPTFFITLSSIVFPVTTNICANKKYISATINITIFMITRFLAIATNLLQ